MPLCASAPPSGPVDSEAYETFCRMITDAVAQGGFDAIWLDLHGAMVTERYDDGEGELLRRIRAIDPHTPLCVAYDMHANVFDAMVGNAQVVTGYQTYPHIDQRQTAERAARALLRVMRGEVRPTTAWGNAPMLPHVMAQGTHRAPNKDLQAMCAAWEASGRALAASLFVGFPHADVPMAGLSAVVVTDNDPDAAQAMVDELLSAAWQARREFMFDIEPLEASVRRAKALARRASCPSCCWITTTTAPAAARWIPPTRCARSSARTWTMWCSSVSTIRMRWRRRSRPASVRRSRCPSARSCRCRNCRWRARR